MQYYLYLLLVPFLYLNYRIILSDIKYQKIPNKLLGYLLVLVPFYYIYLYSTSLQINILLFLWQTILTLLVSFILYYYWVWAAGDAKYLLVLALFIPHIWAIPFIGNIVLLTLLYLIIYFVYFYLWKCLLNWRYTKSLYANIYGDLRDRAGTFLKHWDGNFYKNVIFLKLLRWILLFLILFVSIRLARLYIFAYIKESGYYLQLIDYLKNYTSYILLALIWIFIGVIYGIRILISKLKEILKKESWIESNTTLDFILIGILFIILISFIIYEYRINPSEIKIYLMRIFTLYIGLYIIFKVLRYSQKVTFQLAEQDFIDIKDLRVWDIVDKESLIQIFKSHVAKDIRVVIKNIELVNNVKNTLDIDTVKKIKEAIKKINLYQKKNAGERFNELKKIKILKTFAFWWYIFIWYIITYFLWNNIFSSIVNLTIEYIKKYN